MFEYPHYSSTTKTKRVDPRRRLGLDQRLGARGSGHAERGADRPSRNGVGPQTPGRIVDMDLWLVNLGF